MDEATKEAIGYLERVVQLSKNTAYDLVYRDIDIKCIEILLDYIKKVEE